MFYYHDDFLLNSTLVLYFQRFDLAVCTRPELSLDKDCGAASRHHLTFCAAPLLSYLTSHLRSHFGTCKSTDVHNIPDLIQVTDSTYCIICFHIECSVKVAAQRSKLPLKAWRLQIPGSKMVGFSKYSISHYLISTGRSEKIAGSVNNFGLNY